ncbi:tyrosinase family protein [Paracoccus denitrificans]|jgi:tyrosinase|nr:tyrosinase family protein [Paracoccus denitrificans]MBB4629277.1 tyrosinase [Paracoccus denitrificans]MCU7430296.1 tyrosinase family protein [Paracoccus denitrificans]UPV98553.1 tyrosinase family protein [Paracoccus denitrificans]WQO36667.1 tyrosinase family protein [Paracoccus denitrificans]
MTAYFVDLADYASVRTWSETIYNHLASRSIPLTTDARQFWPLDALETFRLWVNQGWRRTPADPFDNATRLPKPSSPYPPPYLRHDLASMSPAEIDDFRARLDDIMRVTDPSPSSPWQKWAYVHTNWCLHYQEAFAFWHRGFLLYLEAMLGCPVPYWDWMAEDASKDGSPSAGLPRCFLDQTYIHPGTGERRPNPLRYAAAKDGQSKLCAKDSQPGPDCRYVQRNPLFYTTGDDHRAERQALFAMTEIFQQQVVDALQFDSFSVPQGSPGFPWANIPAFDPPQPDDLYPYRDQNFDGAYEQPHDNYHGWIGPDMADNAYTAFDPIFLCYHANIDRMLEVWIRAHPVAQYTAGVALQPFVGPAAAQIDEVTPELWRYTTIGDLAQDSRRLGYDYGPPASPQFRGRAPVNLSGAVPLLGSGNGAGRPMGAAHAAMGAWVIFDGVRCTHDSYAIDVFLGGTAGEARADNAAYVGRFSRIGMGIADDKGRCIRHGVSRVLDASRAAAALGLSAGQDPGLRIRVTNLHGGAELCEDEYGELPGFKPEFHWGDLRAAPVRRSSQSPCCH